VKSGIILGLTLDHFFFNITSWFNKAEQSKAVMTGMVQDGMMTNGLAGGILPS